MGFFLAYIFKFAPLPLFCAAGSVVFFQCDHFLASPRQWSAISLKKDEVFRRFPLVSTS